MSESCPNSVLGRFREESEISNKKGFLDFVRKMVRWTPESRASPSELLEDPWLLGDGGGVGVGLGLIT